MNRQQAIDQTLRAMCDPHMTTAQQILALDRLYNVAHQNGVIYGARVHQDAVNAAADLPVLESTNGR
jgi:hypothetical protein